MDFSTLILLGLIVPIFVLVIYIMTKTLIKKEIPDSRYNPFDYITGQTRVEFQEQKEQKEEKDDQGDDKDKNLKIIVDNHSH
ncbi:MULTISPECIES: DUF3951 domain-containing protein [unclassified Paenibacillus]|uniref:DUF3951 domain-containing protein n=1 Tax=unclassified Paenibacillus TaxID=185978 RepID=UPI00070EAEBE|nr:MULTISPECIES: DUF3951 domain-containing protein [unclassified Paenibacillus]KQX49034.1 hypothetical protein ASD40_12905 [Paenibacillus sp. Root444D2]KRE36649.1 hypothetical protein ASG85_10930 [Paenibacillus sp. Soil724D2]